MRSDRRALHDWPVLVGLASVRLGIPVLLAACALLAVASTLMPPPRSRDHWPFSESLAPFLELDLQWWWFYALVAVLLLSGLSTLAGTWRPLAVRLTKRARVGPRLWGITLMHVGFLGALVAQGLAGLSAGVERGAVIGPRPVELGGRQLTLVSWTPVENPDGSLRTGSGVVRDGDRERPFGYNQPLWLDGYTRSVLIQDAVRIPGGWAVRVVLRRNDGVPVLFASMVVFGAGVLLFVWGRRPRGHLRGLSE